MRKRWLIWAWAFVYWVLFSLLAIAFIVDRPWLSLIIAIIGAVVLAAHGVAWAREDVRKPEQQGK